MRNINNNPTDTELDRALDSALTKFVSVEPRPGLEERILANLRAGRFRVTNRAWWRWGIGAAVAAAVVASVVPVWKPGGLTPPVVAKHPPVTVTPAPAVQMADRENNTRQGQKLRARKTRVRSSPSQVVAADVPKRDRFPSPQPLTEEEMALVQYVQQFPQDAVTIARAQEEFEKELWQELNAAKKAEPSDSD